VKNDRCKSFTIFPSSYSFLKPTRIKVKPKISELVVSLLGHVTPMLSVCILPQELVLPPLTAYPDGELRVLWILKGNIGMSMIPLKVFELLKLFIPNRMMRVPNKANFFQRVEPVLVEGTPLPFALEFELMALSLDPLCQFSVSLPSVRHEKVAIFLFEL
jgi:hypothetical protein